MILPKFLRSQHNGLELFDLYFDISEGEVEGFVELVVLDYLGEDEEYCGWEVLGWGGLG